MILNATNRRIVILFILFLPVVAYLFSALTNWSLLSFTLSGTASIADSLMLFLTLPYTTFLNTTAIGASILLINLILMTLYIALALSLFNQSKKIRLGYGLSGSFFSVFSVGCVACGALLSPLFAFSGIALPLAFLQPISPLLGLTASIIMGVANAKLYQGIKRID